MYTYLHGQPIENPKYFEYRSWRGYLSKYREFKDTFGVVVWYRGYMYLGDKIPIPAKNDSITNYSTLNKIYTKEVKAFRRYKSHKDIKSYIYYDDGVFRGSIEFYELYQNSDGSWDVYYKGIVKKVPYIPAKIKNINR